MTNEREFGILLEKLNSGDSVENECASLLQGLVDMQPAPLEAELQSGGTAKSISLASPEEKARLLRLIEILPNNIDPSVLESFKNRLSEG